MQPDPPTRPARQPRRRTTPPQADESYRPVPPAQPEPPRHRCRRISLFRGILMLLGAGVLLVALARYVVVPFLVMLPRWMGGAP